jgi:hypothetical protein
MAKAEKAPDAAQAEPKRPKQGRSPAYPGIDLEKAIAQAKALYDAEGKYAAPMSSAFTAWGFGAKSSGGRETRAALRYFGLITIEGDGENGKVKLTENALRVLLDEREDQSEKRALIRELALTPAVHKQIFDKFPEGIKSEATVEHFLVFEGGFNKSAAGEVVTEFKATADYAGLFQPDNTVDKPPLPGEEAGNGDTPPPPPPGAGRKGQRTQIMSGERELTTGLLAKDASFRLIVSGNVGVKEIERLIKKLELDKEILADPGDETAEEKDEAAN